jgi:hypothetical protein
MASRAARSNDFPEVIAALAGLPVGTDEVKCANVYAGTTGKDLPAALAFKAGKAGADIVEAMRKISGTTGDFSTSGRKVTG